MLNILMGLKVPSLCVEIGMIKEKMEAAASSSIAVILVVGFLYCFCMVEGCLEKERALLLQLRHDINYPSTNYSHRPFSHWKGNDCCQWPGIYCSNATSRIIGINLSATRKKELGIWYPNITILAQFSRLRHLNLESNYIGGSSTLHAFCKLKDLEELYLSRNSMEDTIPQCLSNMHSLQVLDLPHNLLQGTISPSLFNNLTMIREIGLSDNQFIDVLPFSMFANLSNLVILNLSNNELEVETEFPTWVPRFQLTHLYLGNSKLNRRSGRKIPTFLSSQIILKRLSLSYNSLVGDIPSWLLYNSTQRLFLEGNKLSGTFPFPHQNTTPPLRVLDISNNLLYGPLPSIIFNLCPSLFYFDASRNALQGNLPELPHAGYLEIFALSDNNFSGEVPQSVRKNGTGLTVLMLSNNRLRGDMFPIDSIMPALEILRLDGNDFTTPPNLSSSPNLRVLDIRHNHLSGKLSSWLNCLPQISILLIGGNHFEGPVPSCICEMSMLKLLDLSNNNLEGIVPSCLSNIPSWMNKISPHGILPRYTLGTITLINKGILYPYNGIPLRLMTLIDMSMNKLSGHIPFEMGNMRGICTLNLSNNLIEGPLPVSFENLESLESLDLSHNHLSGTIAREIAKLDFLGVFAVAFNNLSGEIPYQGKFTTFDASSFEGNPGLCGKPLEINCSSNIPLQDEETKEEYGIMDNDLFFYSYVALSFCLGFWGFIASLSFSLNWRRAFFTFADAVPDWCYETFKKAVRNLRN